MLSKVTAKPTREQRNLTEGIVQITNDLGLFIVSPRGSFAICVAPK